jgi:predicted MFS family arabinose efflux permease
MDDAPPQLPAVRPTKGLTALLAIATGTIVANLYFAQPLEETMASSLHSSDSSTSLVVAFTQIGYAVGLFFLVPLGDIFDKRKLISRMLVVTAASLVAVAYATNLPWLMIASSLVGLTCIIAQIIVPYASTLAAEGERGRVVGIVMTGLLLGILFARTFAGIVAQISSWRFVYGFGAVATLLLAFILAKALPPNSERVKVSYGALLQSVLTLLREEPLLRVRSIYGALSFGAFSTLWATAALLLSKPPYSYNNAVIGLFGLVGVGGTLAANLAGRFADRGRTRFATGVSGAIALAGFVTVTVGARHLVAFIIGVVLIDMGVQGIQITNQALVYALDATKRSRIASAYMTAYFLGGAIASALASAAYAIDGWDGVGILGILLTAGILGLWALERVDVVQRATSTTP